MPPPSNQSNADRIDKIDDVLAKLVDQQEKLIQSQSKSDLLIVQLSNQAAQHAEEMKEIKKEQIDMGKVLEGMRIRFSVIQWVGISAATLLMAYIFQHILH